MTSGQHVVNEISSQPVCWERAVDLARSSSAKLPQPGERVAVIGCGTSWFMAQSYAVLRETAGLGETDAFTASEFPLGRSYDRVVAITRSGTTTEVVDIVRDLKGKTPTTSIIGDPDTPIIDVSSDVIAMPFADEKSVVQTRFATTTLALLRAGLGQDLTKAINDARQAVDSELPSGILERKQFTFLGTGWVIGLASEGALKMREAALAWTEAYPAHEYRHGPKSISDENGVVWFVSEAPDGLSDEVKAFGAMIVQPLFEPMAELIRIQKLAVALSHSKGLDPDLPRHLTRSVILSDSES